MLNIIQLFYSKLKITFEEKMINFKEKINDSEKIVDNFFNSELDKIETLSRDLTSLIDILTIKVKKLVNLYRIKFKEQFKSVREEYDKFCGGIRDCKFLNYLVSSILQNFKGKELSIKNRFREIKEFKVKKKILESEQKRLVGFYEFNKSALISEFSVIKDFHNFLEKNKIYLNKHIEDYNSKISSNVIEKINSVLGFDDVKTLFSSKNYLPKNISKIYQPIDRTNQITVYDAENEIFKKILIHPERLPGFTFLPFSRYINFAGKLIICGGYGDKGTSKTVWVLEPREQCGEVFATMRLDTRSKRESPTKNNNFSNIANEYYNNVNRNYIYEDNKVDFIVSRASDMIYSRAGHAMVSLLPNIIFAFSGTEGNRTCELFQLDLNRWEEVASMNNHRIDPSACVFKNYIYVFFGLLYHKQTKKYSFLDTIERISILNMQKREWEFVTPKVERNVLEILPRSLAGIIIKNDTASMIYICGGQVEKDRYSDEIFEVSLESNTISLCDKKLPKPTGFIEQNFLYLFKTGINFDIYGDLYYYNCVNDTFNFIFQKFNEK
jgi:hypothetical protein